MALPQSTTVSYTVFEVLSEPGPDPAVAVLDGLVRGRIPRIDVDIGHDRATGFAVFGDPLDVEFSADKVFAGDLGLFAFRMDRLSIPASTLKLYIRQRVAQNLAATRREKLPKQEREELAEQVRTELLRKAIPAINAFDAVWDRSTGRLRLYATSQAVVDEFQTRARDGLGLVLRPMNTVGVLEGRLDDRELNDVYHLLPTTYLAVGDEDVLYGDGEA